MSLDLNVRAVKRARSLFTLVHRCSFLCSFRAEAVLPHASCPVISSSLLCAPQLEVDLIRSGEDEVRSAVSPGALARTSQEELREVKQLRDCWQPAPAVVLFEASGGTVNSSSPPKKTTKRKEVRKHDDDELGEKEIFLHELKKRWRLECKLAR